MEKDAVKQPKIDVPQVREGKTSRLAYAVTFVIMMAVWCVLSGKFDAMHLSMGVLSSALVTYFSADLLFTSPLSGRSIRTAFGFLMYLPWLLAEILKASVHVLYITLHPRMLEMIDPQVFRFRSTLKSDLAQVSFANSITLTPGTITIYVNFHRDFSVHALDRFSREGLPGEMERRIARAFGEE